MTNICLYNCSNGHQFTVKAKCKYCDESIEIIIGEKRIKMFQLTQNQKKGSACNRFFEDGSNNDIFTPPQLAKKMWEIAEKHWYNSSNYPRVPRILDPCCGKGSLIKPIPEKFYDRHVLALDINEEYINYINKNFDIHWIHINFLEYHSCFLDQSIPETEKFDIILMNPPFSIAKGNYHIPFWDHALELLSNDGIIVSICPDYYLLNSEKRKKLYANHIKEAYILPKILFDTNNDGKPEPLFTHLVVLCKKCENNTFLFLDS